MPIICCIWYTLLLKNIQLVVSRLFAGDNRLSPDILLVTTGCQQTKQSGDNRLSADLEKMGPTNGALLFPVCLSVLFGDTLTKMIYLSNFIWYTLVTLINGFCLMNNKIAPACLLPLVGTNINHLIGDVLNLPKSDK